MAKTCSCVKYIHSPFNRPNTKYPIADADCKKCGGSGKVAKAEGGKAE